MGRQPIQMRQSTSERRDAEGSAGICLVNTRRSRVNRSDFALVRSVERSTVLMVTVCCRCEGVETRVSTPSHSARVHLRHSHAAVTAKGQSPPPFAECNFAALSVARHHTTYHSTKGRKGSQKAQATTHVVNVELSREIRRVSVVPDWSRPTSRSRLLDLVIYSSAMGTTTCPYLGHRLCRGLDLPWRVRTRRAHP